jgi:hypothetical protein
MSQSIKGIQSIVYGYGKKINAPEYLLVVLSAPADDGAPYVELRESITVTFRLSEGMRFSER